MSKVRHLMLGVMLLTSFSHAELEERDSSTQTEPDYALSLAGVNRPDAFPVHRKEPCGPWLARLARPKVGLGTFLLGSTLVGVGAGVYGRVQVLETQLKEAMDPKVGDKIEDVLQWKPDVETVRRIVSDPLFPLVKVDRAELMLWGIRQGDRKVVERAIATAKDEDFGSYPIFEWFLNEPVKAGETRLVKSYLDRYFQHHLASGGKYVNWHGDLRRLYDGARRAIGEGKPEMARELILAIENLVNHPVADHQKKRLEQLGEALPLEKARDLGDFGRELTEVAVSAGDAETLRLLLAKGDRGDLGLTTAITSQNPEMLRVFIEAGIRPNSWQKQWAKDTKNPEIMRALGVVEQ